MLTMVGWSVHARNQHRYQFVFRAFSSKVDEWSQIKWVLSAWYFGIEHEMKFTHLYQKTSIYRAICLTVESISSSLTANSWLFNQNVPSTMWMFEQPFVRFPTGSFCWPRQNWMEFCLATTHTISLMDAHRQIQAIWLHWSAQKGFGGAVCGGSSWWLVWWDYLHSSEHDLSGIDIHGDLDAWWAFGNHGQCGSFFNLILTVLSCLCAIEQTDGWSDGVLRRLAVSIKRDSKMISSVSELVRLFFNWKFQVEYTNRFTEVKRWFEFDK